MTCRKLLVPVLFWLSALTWGGSGSTSPTAPTPPASDFAAQFDSLWSTFDREYSHFVHKQIDLKCARRGLSSEIVFLLSPTRSVRRGAFEGQPDGPSGLRVGSGGLITPSLAG
jgi:hypothetical protein